MIPFHWPKQGLQNSALIIIPPHKAIYSLRNTLCSLDVGDNRREWKKTVASLDSFTRVPGYLIQLFGVRKISC